MWVHSEYPVKIQSRTAICTYLICTGEILSEKEFVKNVDTGYI